MAPPQQQQQRKCRGELENFQHITAACSALAQGDYSHHHNKVTSIVHQ
jgi:hypothetical protein